MKIMFVQDAWQDYLFWQETNKPLVKRIHQLIKDITRNPFTGLGKPEALRFDMAGYWSRRINHEHRLVYKIDSDLLIILQCRYHY